MDSFFSNIDRWGGFVLLIVGIYSTLLAFGYIFSTPENSADSELWRKKLAPLMKVLGPILIFVGFIDVLHHL